jgi:hypothetical protein
MPAGNASNYASFHACVMLDFAVCVDVVVAQRCCAGFDIRG